jgi:hypothetical protein
VKIAKTITGDFVLIASEVNPVIKRYAKMALK